MTNVSVVKTRKHLLLKRTLRHKFIFLTVPTHTILFFNNEKGDTLQNKHKQEAIMNVSYLDITRK